MQCDLNAEVGGNGLYRTRELGVGGTEIVIFHNSVRSAAVGALNGIQLHIRPLGLKLLRTKPLGLQSPRSEQVGIVGLRERKQEA